MRVLLVNDYSSAIGGAEQIVRRSYELLSDEDIDVRLFAADMVLTRRSPLTYVHDGPFCRALERLVRDWRPDVVHLHNYYHLCSPSTLAVLGAARREGHIGAVVHTAHDYHLLCPSPGLLRWSDDGPVPVDPGRPLGWHQVVGWRWDEGGWVRSELRALQHLVAYDLRHLERHLDLVLCPSRFSAAALAPVAPTAVLANPAPGPVASPKPSGRLRSVFAGRLVPEKGLVPFLRWAPAELLDGLIVAGTGPEEAAARTAVAERGLGTQFLGQVGNREVLELLAGSHLVVLPARSFENAPTVLFEALSRGAGILGSDLGGVAEIVQDSGVGALFDPWDPTSVSRAGEAVLAAHDPIAPPEVDASDYLAARSEERHVAGLLGHYRSLLGARGGRGAAP